MKLGAMEDHNYAKQPRARLSALDAFWPGPSIQEFREPFEVSSRCSRKEPEFRLGVDAAVPAHGRCNEPWSRAVVWSVGLVNLGILVATLHGLHGAYRPRLASRSLNHDLRLFDPTCRKPHPSKQPEVSCRV